MPVRTLLFITPTDRLDIVHPCEKEVDMLTTALALGGRKLRMRLGFRVGVIFGFAFAALLLLLLGYAASTSSTDPFIEHVLLSLAAIILVVAIAFWICASSIKITISDEGIKYTSLTRSKEILWEQITETRYRVTPVKVALYFGLLGALLSAVLRWKPSKTTLRIRSVDGTEIKLTSNLSHAKDAMGVIFAKTIPPIVDAANARLQRGENVNFGPVTLSRTALLWKNASVPFTELSRAELLLGQLRVKRKDKWFPYFSLRSDNVPNVLAFLEVLEGMAPQLKTAGVDPMALQESRSDRRSDRSREQLFQPGIQ